MARRDHRAPRAAHGAVGRGDAPPEGAPQGWQPGDGVGDCGAAGAAPRRGLEPAVAPGPRPGRRSRPRPEVPAHRARRHPRGRPPDDRRRHPPGPPPAGAGLPRPGDRPAPRAAPVRRARHPHPGRRLHLPRRRSGDGRPPAPHRQRRQGPRGGVGLQPLVPRHGSGPAGRRVHPGGRLPARRRGPGALQRRDLRAVGVRTAGRARPPRAGVHRRAGIGGKGGRLALRLARRPGGAVAGGAHGVHGGERRTPRPGAHRRPRPTGAGNARSRR